VKLSSLLVCASSLLAACQTVPDPTDTTNATMRFRIHYEAPGLTTPHVEISTQTSLEARRCIYVNDPFGVVANVSDKGGVRSIVIGPSLSPDVVSVRDNSGDIVAIGTPAEPTQGTPPNVFPNPGHRPGEPVVIVLYSTAKAFDAATLLSVYQFKGGATRAAMRGTARNFGATTGVSEVYNFFVEKATSNPAQRPGMSCAVP
jgi:hypothetical protein